MASSSRPCLPAPGTVTARLQKLQNPAELEISTKSSRLPRPMTRARESGTTISYSRRMDSSSGSPTGRASRDGKEGLGGDGRPPIENLIRTIQSSPEKEVVLRSPQLSVQRPATSFDVDSETNLLSTQIIHINGLQPSRKPRSLENLQKPKIADNEIVQAMARLRSVKQPVSAMPASSEKRDVGTGAVGHQSKPSQDRLDSHGILDELDTLLVGALRRANTITGQALDGPAGSTDAESVETSEIPSSSGDAELPSKEQQEYVPVAPSTQKGPSPVKARRAVFESVKSFNPGDFALDRFNRGGNIPASSVKSIRQKFEKQASRPPKAHTPPIELALPKLINRSRGNSLRGSGMTHPESRQDETATQSGQMGPSSIEATQDRKFSVTWPFKWGLFPQDKGTPAPPEPSGIEAKAESGHDNHVTDSSMEHITNHIYVSPARSALSVGRRPYEKGPANGNLTGQGAIEASSSQEGMEVFMGERISRDSAFQGSPQHRQETEPEKSQTPKKRGDLISEQLITPTKLGTPRRKLKPAASAPITPLRGRPRSVREDSCTVEQRYSLSRSRSRGGLKIQVEVRSPDPSPDKSNEDTVVIIRTNIEPMDQ